jgi:hypothetical protein
VRVYVATTLGQWAEAVIVDARRGWFSKSFYVEAEHRHGAACDH